VTDIPSVFVRVTAGPIFEICSKHHARAEAVTEQMNALILEFGCTPGRFISCGSLLEGFWKGPGAKPVGWMSAGKKFPGYIKPDPRTVAGQDAAAKLEAIKLPTGEDLAHDLGFPPFFKCVAGGFCSAAFCDMRGGVFYLAFPAALAHRLKNKPGVEFIEEKEYKKAVEGT